MGNRSPVTGLGKETVGDCGEGVHQPLELDRRVHRLIRWQQGLAHFHAARRANRSVRSARALSAARPRRP